MKNNFTTKNHYMKGLKRTILLLLFAYGYMSLAAQSVTVEQFGWTIQIPEGFEEFDPQIWEKHKKKGEQMIEDTFQEDIENLSKTLLVFRKGDANFIEANYQPFELEAGETYEEINKDVTSAIFQTFETQMPNVKKDSTSSIAMIGGLEFTVFEINLNFSEVTTMKFLMYSRLFGDQELTINLMFIDEKEGEKLLTSWKNSTFK